MQKTKSIMPWARYGDMATAHNFWLEKWLQKNLWHAIRSNIYRQQDQKKVWGESKQSILRGTKLCSTRQSHQPFRVTTKSWDNLSKSLEMLKTLMAMPFLNDSVKTKQEHKKNCAHYTETIKAKNNSAKDKWNRITPGKGTRPSTKK